MPTDHAALAANVVQSYFNRPSEADRQALLAYATDTEPAVRREVVDALLQAAADLHAENQQLKQPPLQVGVVCDPAYGHDPGLVLVRELSGRHLVCAYAGAPEPALGVGSSILLNREGAIISHNGIHRGHVIGRIARHNPDQHEVTVATSLNQEEELILTLTQPLRARAEVKAGALVRYDPILRLATELVARPEEGAAQAVLERLPSLTWDHLIAPEGVWEQILDMWDEVVDALEQGEPLRWLGVVTGPPGTGKTHFLRIFSALLNQYAEVAFILVKGTEPVTPLLGQSEANIRSYFAQAQANAAEGRLTVLVWDEFEATFPARGLHTNLWPSTLTNTLLGELDGLQRLENFIFCGVTNRLDLIDPALARPNRLGGNIIVMQRPGWPETESLFHLYLQQARRQAVEPTPDLAAQAAAFLWAPVNRQARPLARVRFVDGREEIVPRTALLSGDLVRGAVEHADRRAQRRLRQGGLGVITFEDICWGLDRLYGGLPLTPANLAAYLDDWSLDRCAQVAEVIRPKPEE